MHIAVPATFLPESAESAATTVVRADRSTETMRRLRHPFEAQPHTHSRATGKSPR